MKKIGSDYQGDNQCTFTVWAPDKQRMLLQVVQPQPRTIEMQPQAEGYFFAEVSDLPPGSQYFFRPDDQESYPDPASRFQPLGVHGPSEVVDHAAYAWQDATWRGVPFPEVVLYELHVGTFTPEGTFEAIIPRLPELADMGINALEIMPVAQFPGQRNWGYDGVFPYAVQNSYGGPEGLKKLVDACHASGIAVYLDVVYNHLGPEGNYLSDFGPYFTEKYCTPWGNALNFDDAYSDGVRDFFVGNALYWIEEFHMDGLRFDAIHTIFDQGAVSLWAYLYSKVHQLELKLGRTVTLIAESDLNSPHILKKPEAGGFGFTAQWLDDFHHSFYAVLDEKEGKKRYGDFGRMDQIAKAYTDGFVHSGEYVSFRKRRYGASSAGIPGDQFIAFMDNHDQAGNRLLGERLSSLIDTERLKVAAAALLLAPYVPMLFMGEEYAERAPFLYFIHHSEPELIKMVQEGRTKDFKSFNDGDEQVPPDPQEEQTFRDSILHWEERTQGKHDLIRRWYKTLIGLRREIPLLQNYCKNDIRVQVIDESGFVLFRQNDSGQEHLMAVLNLSGEDISFTVPAMEQTWNKILDSKEEQWLESSQPTPAVDHVYDKTLLTVTPWSVTVYQSES